ncbi:MAG: hypothetical protein OQJ91_10995 [Motiliproteus sp.]|nr:hypothetical protein [Motiliproteus sp.]
MGVFRDAFKTIGEAVTDMSSLDVVTYKGSIEAELSGNKMPENFQDVLNLAGTSEVKLKLLASTQMKLDGDILAYSDTAITPEEAEAHRDLVELGQENRLATIDFVHRVVGLDDIA